MKRMASYMLILGGADLDKRSSNNPQIAAAMLNRYTAWIDGLRQSGHYLSSYKLRDQTGRRLTLRGGEVVDGPFIESKEAIGGVFVIEAASLEEAAELARSCPTLNFRNGYVEVRVVEVLRA